MRLFEPPLWQLHIRLLPGIEFNCLPWDLKTYNIFLVFIVVYVNVVNKSTAKCGWNTQTSYKKSVFLWIVLLILYKVFQSFSAFDILTRKCQEKKPYIMNQQLFASSKNSFKWRSSLKIQANPIIFLQFCVISVLEEKLQLTITFYLWCF